MYRPATSADGAGASNRGQDKTGFFELETLTIVGPPIDMTLRFHRDDPAGHYSDVIEPMLAVVENFHAPNQIRIEAIRGSEAGFTKSIPSVTDIDQESQSINNLFLRYVRALKVIQRHTSIEIKVPPYESLEDLNIPSVLQAARLLEGETIYKKWEKETMGVPKGAAELVTPAQIVATKPFSVQVGSNQVDLGMARYVIEAAEVVERTVDSDGDPLFTLVPAFGKNTFGVTWLGEGAVGDVEEEQ